MASYDFGSVVDSCANLNLAPGVSELASKYGLAVQHIQWEDTSRFKNSSWGDNITDMTLRVSGRNMPAIRPPNFEDLSWDEPVDNIRLVVGNQAPGLPTTSISLREYLTNIQSYLPGGDVNTPYPYRGRQGSLFSAEKDANVLMSSQSCFLPAVKQSSEALRGDAPPVKTEFYPAMYTYGNSDDRDPKVLYILATSQGTSAQIREQPPPGGSTSGGQSILYFNKAGERAPLEAMSLIAERIIRNSGNTDAPGIYDINMNEKEQERNIVMVIQVPLVKYGRPSFGFPGKTMAKKGSFSFGAVSESASLRQATPQMDNAVISVGSARGSFKGLSDVRQPLVRDNTKPVRITLQFYKTTETGSISDGDMRFIAEQIKRSRQHGVAFGSLVTGVQMPLPLVPQSSSNPFSYNGGSWDWSNYQGGARRYPNTGRTTETTPNQSIPFWWDTVWARIQRFVNVPKSRAENFLFSYPTSQIFSEKYQTIGVDEAQTRVLNVLRSADMLSGSVVTETGPDHFSFGSGFTRK